jgi:hypothetical protein
MVPVVMVMPFEEEMPPAERAPESTVEVPVTVERMFPPLTVNPPDEEMPVEESPCTTVEVPAV